MGALVYSGRPDPSWDVSPSTAAACVHAFEKLEHTRAAVPDQASLGYRGAWLLAPDSRRWDAFNGIAWSAQDRRGDPERAMERALLESAPDATLPSEWRQWLFPLRSE